MVHTCLVSAKDKTEQPHGTAAFWPRQKKSKIKFKQLPNSFGVWGFGFFSKSSAEANLHNYLLHCGFSDIKLLPIYLRSNSSSESWKHSSCHPLKPLHNRYLTVYNHKLMGVQTSSFPLFVLPGVAISWGQLMLNTEPLKPTSGLSVFATEKKSKSQTDLSRKACLQLSSGWYHTARLDSDTGKECTSQVWAWGLQLALESICQCSRVSRCGFLNTCTTLNAAKEAAGSPCTAICSCNLSLVLYLSLCDQLDHWPQN